MEINIITQEGRNTVGTDFQKDRLMYKAMALVGLGSSRTAHEC